MIICHLFYNSSGEQHIPFLNNLAGCTLVLGTHFLTRKLEIIAKVNFVLGYLVAKTKFCYIFAQYCELQALTCPVFFVCVYQRDKIQQNVNMTREHVYIRGTVGGAWGLLPLVTL